MRRAGRAGILTAGAGIALLLVFIQLDKTVPLLEDSAVHVTLIAVSVLVSLGLGFIALRMFYLDGRIRSLALGAGFVFFAAIYIWHGYFTKNGHLFAFLIYGPTSRLFFGIGLVVFASKQTLVARQRFPSILKVIGAGLAVAIAGYLLHPLISAWAYNANPSNFYPIRAAVEILAMVAVGTGLALHLKHWGKTSPLQSPLITVTLVLLLLQSIFFLVTNAWTITWWMAHAIGATSTALLSGTVWVDYQRNERRAELEYFQEMNSMKTSFINSAAHEIGTPLTPIMLQLHLLNKDRANFSEKNQRSIELISKNLHRLDRLVQRILDGSKALAGKLKVTPAEFDLAEALQELHASYEAVAKSQNISCSFECPANLMVQSDRLRIQQVAANAMDNAIKFTPHGGSIVCKLDVDGDDAVIVVKDSGAGMDAELINRLFQPFTQGPAASSGHTGSGLGLFLSRQIMETLGGSITAESDGPGTGTTITFRLPIKSDADSEQDDV